MLNGEEEFKFYIYEDQVFFLEKALLDNNIEFHNELELGSNTRTNKYYIKNLDRLKFDEICKESKFEIFLDSLPGIETRYPKLNVNSSHFISIILFIIIIIFIIAVI
jgi:hypothetical protein